MATEIYVVLVTAPDEDTACGIAKSLVLERLAACVNVVPGVRSFYRWEAKLQDDSEVLMILKTAAAALEQMKARLLELHPYSNPEFLAIEPTDGAKAYVDWVKFETSERNAE